MIINKYTDKNGFPYFISHVNNIPYFVQNAHLLIKEGKAFETKREGRFEVDGYPEFVHGDRIKIIPFED